VDKSVRAPQALLLSPTRELAQQTHSVLSSIGDYLRFRTHVCIGGTQVASDLQALRDGVQIIVGTPGRICALIDKRQLNLETMKIVVLDEADELLNKGFVDSMRFVLRSVPAQTQLCLCSATMPREVIELSTRFMRNPVEILVKTEDVTLDGITQYYVAVENQDKYSTLADIFDQLSLQQTIVYCNSRRSVEWLNTQMTKDDHVVSCIHSDMDPATRTGIMQSFRTGKSRVLISTDLTARGIDVQTVSLVINFEIPRDKECYIHRIGRSGRHGRKGTAINFVSEAEAADLRIIEEFWKTHIGPLPENLADIKLI
jgi:translation initiation factor 4A